MCRFLRLVAEFDRRSGWADQGAISCAAWLAWRCSISPTTAREHVRVAQALEGLPRTAALFARGRLSYSKVRAITRLDDVQHEEALLAIAVDATAAQLERAVRDHRTVARLNAEATTTREERFLRLDEQDDGSVRLRGRLGAEEAAVLRAALDHAREQLRTGQADAAPDQGPLEQRAAMMSTRWSRSPTPHWPPPCWRAARPPSATRSSCTSTSTPSTPAPRRPATWPTARPWPPRSCGVCAATAATSRSSSARAARSTSGAVPGRSRPRCAGRCRPRDQGCRFPGCQRTRHLDAHHVEHWVDGGATRPENLILLCGRHHTALHEGGFTLKLATDGRPTFRRPDGQLLPVHSKAPCVDGRRLRRRHITPATIAPGSNTPYDPDLVVAAMLQIAPLRLPAPNATD